MSLLRDGLNKREDTVIHAPTHYFNSKRPVASD